MLHPYQMAKDHRTDMEISDVNAVLDGRLDPFAEAYLKWVADAGSVVNPKAADETEG